MGLFYWPGEQVVRDLTAKYQPESALKCSQPVEVTKPMARRNSTTALLTCS